MPKNPCNSTKNYFYTHDCILYLICLSAKADRPSIGLCGVSEQAFFSISASPYEKFFCN
jgi:hypothetical protein